MMANFDKPLHPVHLILIVAALSLFTGALVSDFAYISSYQVQWTNFASWLIAAGLVFCGVAIIWTFVELFRKDRVRERPLLALLLLVATWLAAFINALVHAKDAWASMPLGLILSIIAVGLSIAAIWAMFKHQRIGGTS
ncbi:DUF2231 domain-containing protein [Sphingorhabdus sp.]|uniref:DUF2231 domain-containing protein n=1 Tax=Sphingorhabdus sp. TaxID=1902408 RepID=UPI003593A48A